MVKIIERQQHSPSPLEDKFESLLSMARELVPGEYRVVREVLAFGIDTRTKNEGIMVMPLLNRVIVYNKSYYDAALKLAQAYESKTTEEFTLDKNF